MNQNQSPLMPCSEIFATTLRTIGGMVITIEKGARVQVKDVEDGRCTVCLFDHATNPRRIWNTIVNVPTKYLQFDPQNDQVEARDQ